VRGMPNSIAYVLSVAPLLALGGSLFRLGRA
jgi:hypothetical protein